eukprot:scaffold4606_cov242-Skeletonema_menzelii.AAC.1
MSVKTRDDLSSVWVKSLGVYASLTNVERMSSVTIDDRGAMSMAIAHEAPLYLSALPSRRKLQTTVPEVNPSRWPAWLLRMLVGHWGQRCRGLLPKI